MASGRRRINLEQDSRGFWARLFRRPCPPALVADHELVLDVDFSLRRRASVRAVRAFVESIDTYQLHTRKTVHVVSGYVIPPDPGLQDKIPEWLAERVRFGISQGAGEFGYLRIRSVDVAWDDEGTELFLHLQQKVVPGTRAFIAAYLGEGDGEEQMNEQTSSMLLGDPG
jgi:hypothetical protein